MSWETMMPSGRSIERTPERPPIRLFELSATDRACIERLVGHTLALVEREFILQTLRDNQGNRTRSARLLAISIRSLRDKIRSYRDQGESVPERRAEPQRKLRLSVSARSVRSQEKPPSFSGARPKWP